MTDAARRRQQRERIIRRRVALIRCLTHAEPWRSPGHFAKVKPFDCSCWRCQMPTHPNPYRGKERQEVRWLAERAR